MFYAVTAAAEIEYFAVVDEAIQNCRELGIDLRLNPESCQLLIFIEAHIGDLDKVAKFVQLIGYVRSADEFTDQPTVMNATSRFLLDIFGERENFTRLALGTSERLEILVDMIQAATQNDFLSYYHLTGKLHKLIVAASGSRYLIEMIEKVSLQITRFQFRNLLIAGRINKSMTEHANIVDAICESDGDGAERYIREHIGIVRELVVIASKKPEFKVL